jgi:acetyltransferase-like isoleucine patch superfamily enzyme
VKFLKRFLTPRFVVSLYYLIRFGAAVSPRAEVDLTRNIRMGKGCRVSSFAKIKASDGPLRLGRRCEFGTGSWVSTGAQGITLGDNVVCGPLVVISGNNYVFDTLGVHVGDQGVTSKGVRIGNNVWIGAHCTILDGSVLGDDVVVAAHSLVNRSIPAGAMVQGNPAEVFRMRTREED